MSLILWLYVSHIVLCDNYKTVCRHESRSEDLYTRYTRCVSSGRHLYSGYTLRVLLYSSQELQVWMQSRIFRWWS